MSEIDAYFDRLRGGTFGSSDPNVVPHQVIAVGDGNVQPTGWYAEHGFSSFVGQKNLIVDPALQFFERVSPIGTAANTKGSWLFRYVLNSGTAPSTRTVDLGFFRTENDNPFNTNTLALSIGGFAAGNTTFYIYPSSNFAPSLIPTLPYLVGSWRLAKALPQTLTAITSAAVKLELVDDVGTVQATGPAADWLTMGDNSQTQLVVAMNKTPAEFTATGWTLRIRVDVVASGSGGSLDFDFGEPQLNFAYTTEPPPFAPQIGTWKPSLIEYLGSGSVVSTPVSIQSSPTSLNPGFVINSSGHILFGPETSTQDVRIRRSGTNTLSIDNGLGQAAALTLVGKRIATPQATQTVVAGTAISVTSEVVQISASAPTTMTAAPTIADGVDGQMLTLLNVGANNITIQDQGTLAGSNLRLTATTVTLGPRQSVKLMYSATVGDWVQVGPLVAVL